MTTVRCFGHLKSDQVVPWGPSGISRVIDMTVQYSEYSILVWRQVPF
ncbi:hypothetical protein XENTR_v10006959 [Xenopus tropicalis]|nr:hypothetical protein XENTR_v10006959 [Xenopus tropicalis]